MIFEKNRKQVQTVLHIIRQRGDGDLDFDIQKVVALLIHLLEEQEKVKIEYTFVEPAQKKEETG